MPTVLDVHGRILRRGCFAVCRGPVQTRRHATPARRTGPFVVSAQRAKRVRAIPAIDGDDNVCSGYKEAHQIGIVSMAMTQTALKKIWKRALHRTARATASINGRPAAGARTSVGRVENELAGSRPMSLPVVARAVMVVLTHCLADRACAHTRPRSPRPSQWRRLGRRGLEICRREPACTR
jgi:hypothetical protein